MTTKAQANDAWIERYIISAVLSDPDNGRYYSMARDMGIKHTFFTKSEHQIIWSCFERVYKAGKPIDIGSVFDRIRRTRSGDLQFRIPGVDSPDVLLSNIVSVTSLTQLASTDDSYAGFEHHLQAAKDRMSRIELQSLAADIRIMSESESIGDVIEKAKKRIDSIQSPSSGKYPEPVGIKQLPYPKRDDSSMLVGNDWLNRGGAALLVSYAGQGKSSLTFSMAAHWSIGRDFHGLKPKAALRILIIQAEDDNRYMGKLAASAQVGMGLNPEEIDRMNENLMIVRDKSHLGPEFFPMIRHYAQHHQPDLIIINPIYLYAAGDITRNEVAAEFIVGLETANADQRFAYMLVHHTGKPAGKDTKGNRAKVDSWETMYMGFGSSFLANYPRCTMMLEPSAEMGRYNLRFGKGVTNAGIYESVPTSHGYSLPKPTDRIPLKYSDRKMVVYGNEEKVIFWEKDDSARDEDKPDSSESTKKDEGDGWVKDYLTMFDEVNPIAFSQLLRLVQNIDGASKGQMQRRLNRLVDDGFIRNCPPKGYIKIKH